MKHLKSEQKFEKDKTGKKRPLQTIIFKAQYLRIF